MHKYVGRTFDERLFFLTSPWIPENLNEPRREFVALYIFDFEGNLIDAEIDERENPESFEEEEQLMRRRLKQLSKKTYRCIRVVPFGIYKYGIEFGLIPFQSEVNGDWWVNMQPSNYMAFCAPWDNGEYFT
jgi:hypothetical protein